LLLLPLLPTVVLVASLAAAAADNHADSWGETIPFETEERRSAAFAHMRALAALLLVWAEPSPLLLLLLLLLGAIP